VKWRLQEDSADFGAGDNGVIGGERSGVEPRTGSGAED
jgi:hypothetical protein